MLSIFFKKSPLFALLFASVTDSKYRGRIEWLGGQFSASKLCK
jgi:hypothetical protein